MNPLVSIITPTYNRGYIIKNAVQSILDQTYKNFELIIIDDGSKDNTELIIKNYKDKRIRYEKQKNSGQGIARNKGLSLAEGEWIAFLDSDNELFPEHLETIINEIHKDKNILYVLPMGIRTLELYKNGKQIKFIDDSIDFPKKLTIKDIFMRKLHFDLNGFVHNRIFIEEGIRFDPKIKQMEDWEYVLTIGEKYPNNFLYLVKKLYHYHQRYGGDGVVSNTTYKEWADVFEYIYQKHKNDKLMVGQKWYPDRVNKWNRISELFKEGKLPPPHLYRFQDLLKTDSY